VTQNAGFRGQNGTLRPSLEILRTYLVKKSSDFTLKNLSP
jgi:hypothetical protein